MNALSPDLIDRPKTLAEVIQRLTTMPTLTGRQRRDLVSAVNRTAKLLGRLPEEIAADVPALRNALQRIAPRPARLTAKSFANIRADLGKALTLTRVAPRPHPPKTLSKNWESFLGSAAARHQAWDLARLSAFCAFRKIEPDAVTDATLAAFQAYLDARLLTNDPKELVREMAWSFNAIVQKNQLNRPLLTVPAAERYWAAPMTTYPATLREDFGEYKKRLSHEDIFLEDGPQKALKPMSIRNIEAHVRQFLDVAVNTGCEPSQFRTLADVVKPDVVKAAFKAIFSSNGNKFPVGLQNTAGTLLAIARHHVKASDADIAALKTIKARTFSEQNGMSGKNRERLDQFDEWKNISALANLLIKLMNRAKAKPDSSRSALAAMHAVAIGILLEAPIRVKNLAGLDIEQNLRVTTGKGQHRNYGIRFESGSVKNSVLIEFHLSPETSGLIRTYLDRFRLKLSDAPGDALFPMRQGDGARSPANFSQNLQAVIKRETGLIVHSHLFRHLAAKTYLDHHPGDFETVQRLLGHKKRETTVSFYARIDNARAQERYHEAVLVAQKPRAPK